MPIPKKIENYLKEAGYKYEIVEHRTTYTAWDTAQTTQKQEKKIKPEEIVKALAVKSGKDHFLALVPANKKLDKKKLLKTVNTQRKKDKIPAVKSIDLAKEAWMKKNLPGKVGATPAFRNLLGLDVYIDNILAKQKNIYIGSGEYEFSIEVPTKQYLKTETPVKGSFSAKK